MPSSLGSVELDVQAGKQRSDEPPQPDTPFRIAVLGDFSGRGNRDVPESRISTRKVHRIDRDNFDEVLARIAPELVLPVAGSVKFGELEDFHPDRLYERLTLFELLRETRKRLGDPRTFAAAAAELQPSTSPKVVTMPQRRVSLDDLLDSAESRPPEQRPDDLRRIVNEIVAPHLTPKAHPKQAELIEKVDEATALQMRAILHSPDFQALEAAWEGVFFLIRRIETGTDLQVCLIDVSKAELAADLLPAEDLRKTEIYRLIVEQTVRTPGAQPWAVLAGNYIFDSSLDDVDLLARLSLLARAARAPFISAASPAAVGCACAEDLAETGRWASDPKAAQYWSRLRAMPEACWLGLALPRFLLRLPYGGHTDAAEQFAFEEYGPEFDHEHYLWGNPALACACLLGQAFSRAGWNLRPGAVREIPDLPAHIYHEDGESKLKPCAEVLMTEDGAGALMDAGLMPFVSLKGSDRIRLMRFQSVADPPAALEGRWC